MAATTGFGQFSSMFGVKYWLRIPATSSAPPGASVHPFSMLTSAPAMKARPLPVITTTRTSGSFANWSTARTISLDMASL